MGGVHLLTSYSDRLERMPGWRDLTRAPECGAQILDALSKLGRCRACNEVRWRRNSIRPIQRTGELLAGVFDPPLLDQVTRCFDHVSQGLASPARRVPVARTRERPRRHRRIEEREDIGNLLLRWRRHVHARAAQRHIDRARVGRDAQRIERRTRDGRGDLHRNVQRLAHRDGPPQDQPREEPGAAQRIQGQAQHPEIPVPRV